MLNFTGEKKNRIKTKSVWREDTLRAEGVHAAGQLSLRHLLHSVAPHPLETADILPTPNPTSSNGNQAEKGKKKRKCCKFIFLQFITYETMTYSSLPRKACARAATHTAAGSKKPFPFSPFSAAAQQDLPFIWQPGHSAGQSNSPAHL